MNLENAVLDIYDDVNLKHTLVKVAMQLPESIRNEQLPSVEDKDQLEDSQFALSLFTKSASKMNKFPINSRINTALSNLYFDINHHKLPYEAQKIAAAYLQRACDKFGVVPSYSVKTASKGVPLKTNIYFERATETVGHFKQASNQGCYALEGKYPINTKDDIKKADEYFNKYAGEFNLESKHEYAKNVCKKATELGVITGHNIQKYAAANYGSKIRLEQSLSLRKSLLDEDSNLSEAFDKLASYRDKVEPETLAKTLYELDKKANIDRHYNGYLMDPYEAVCGMPKVASYIYQKDHIYMTEKDLKDAVANKEKILNNYFGDTLVKGLKSEGEAAFIALPDDTKDIIARIWNGEIQ
jgi:hypothetical protein